MSSSDIAVRDNPAASRFEAEVDGHLAIAEYKLEDGAIVFTHTVVPEALGGRGVASALARAALGSARERGLRVKPECSFFAGYMTKHPETHDLAHPDSRAALGI